MARVARDGDERESRHEETMRAICRHSPRRFPLHSGHTINSAHMASSTTATNPYRVESPADLQAQLSTDLDRVSVLYFRADWAEPCKQMDDVTTELAKRWPDVLFLSVSSRLGCAGPLLT